MRAQPRFPRGRAMRFRLALAVIALTALQPRTASSQQSIWLGDEVHRSMTAFFSERGQTTLLCLYKNRESADALEDCHVDPSSPGALGAMWVMSDRQGAALYSRPWINAHCAPIVQGYRCEWKGLTITYQ